MFGLASNIRLIIGGVVAAAIFGIGWKVGHYRVEQLEEQIRQIEAAGQEADKKRVEVQAALDKIVKDKDEELARRLAEGQAEAQKLQDELTAARAGTKDRIAAEQAKIKALTAERAKLVDQLSQARSPQEREKVQEQINNVDRQTGTSVATIDSNRCLALAVPVEFIKPFIKK